MNSTMPSSYISKSNERFNAAAVAWDSNPDVHHASTLALQSILKHFPNLLEPRTDKSTGLDVLEIGCGTGLLSLMLAPHVRALTAVDTAQGMIDAFKLKLQGLPEVQNVLPVCVTLGDPDDPLIRPDPLDNDDKEAKNGTRPLRRFDLIISHLVLHHIPSLEDIFSTMYACLRPGGSVALTDFEDFGPQARRFHPESQMDGVERHGIHRGAVKKLLESAGFVDVRVETAFEVEKGVEAVPGGGIVKGEGGEKMIFPFLICLGRKA